MVGATPTSTHAYALAVENAKAGNMPTDNIVRAIKKGTGEIEGVSYEEVSYEGYGPGGVALYIECLTDNQKRGCRRGPPPPDQARRKPRDDGIGGVAVRSQGPDFCRRRLPR